jgi:hypothetical protein
VILVSQVVDLLCGLVCTIGQSNKLNKASISQLITCVKTFSDIG